MKRPHKPGPVDRIIDANYNRAKEGLRVCEEITRFILDNRSLTSGFKSVRHRLVVLLGMISCPAQLLEARASSRDVGRTVYGRELTRGSISDIFFSNIQRVKESVRVLEEFGKLKSRPAALGFKNIRYRVYELEKKTAAAVAALRDPR